MNLKFRNFICVAVCFAAGFLYSFGIFYAEKATHTYITLGFVAFLILLFLLGLRLVQTSLIPIEIRRVAVLAGLGGIAIQAGIIAGLTFANAPDSALWVSDTYTSHLPLAESVANFLTGKSDLPASNGFSDKVLFTHVYVGVFFAILGAKPWVSALAMLLLKCFTLCLIWQWSRKLFDEKAAAIGVMAYGLMPTVMFYTLTFYKESVIHFLVAVILLSLFEIQQKRNYRYFFFLIPTLIGLMYERFYIFPPFLLVLMITLLFQSAVPKKIKTGMVIVAIALGAVFMTAYGRFFPIEGIWQNLQAMRASLNSYTDINPAFNRDLAYPLAVIKITFTPFFTLSKFDLFHDLSYLLIWGSFFNQAIIALALVGFYRCIRNNWRAHWYYGVPFLWFIILYAYLAPYSGRQRDSFYPLIATYCAIAISPLLIRKSDLNVSNRNT